jgi:ABC-type multidrug transport system ATPase subunit
MKITLENIGKKYNREWIFQNMHMDFEEGCCVGVTGGNGSGKSTFIQLLAGYSTPSSGRILWEKNGRSIEAQKIFEYISWCTPQVALYEEFTLQENIEFYLKYKRVRDGLATDDIIRLMRLEHYSGRMLRQYSSGMRQRVKLGLAILAETPLLFLDEPVSHLDAQNTLWFQELLASHKKGRSIFIASNNNKDELFLTEKIVVMDEYRK